MIKTYTFLLTHVSLCFLDVITEYCCFEEMTDASETEFTILLSFGFSCHPSHHDKIQTASGKIKHKNHLNNTECECMLPWYNENKLFYNENKLFFALVALCGVLALS